MIMIPFQCPPNGDPTSYSSSDDKTSPTAYRNGQAKQTNTPTDTMRYDNITPHHPKTHQPQIPTPTATSHAAITLPSPDHPTTHQPQRTHAHVNTPRYDHVASSPDKNEPTTAASTQTNMTSSKPRAHDKHPHPNHDSHPHEPVRDRPSPC